MSTSNKRLPNTPSMRWARQKGACLLGRRRLGSRSLMQYIQHVLNGKFHYSVGLGDVEYILRRLINPTTITLGNPHGICWWYSKTDEIYPWNGRHLSDAYAMYWSFKYRRESRASYLRRVMIAYKVTIPFEFC